MRALPPSSKYVARRDDPVDDAERTALVTRVNDAYTAGQLDDDSYRRCLDAVFAAARLGDLAPVVEQLPTPTAAEPSGLDRAPVAPGELTPARPRNLVPFALAGAGALVILVVLLAILL
ncbi:DUF1707 SHOCT-like domain-containing protein [Acidipropionibacterium timonense]|uniref:DUF1707 SHOCT-like domain-containing protein n=1 Tax=Acidipropionibacterium timonense TaxID=2161818 RepID=UPI00102F7380|nr:DUF1707 domain-containing protein [Acidipropionibacterium timonense]